MWRGRVTRPTPRSVLARQRNQNFDGGWRDDTFVRATMIRTLAKNVMMESAIFIVIKNIV